MKNKLLLFTAVFFLISISARTIVTLSTVTSEYKTLQTSTTQTANNSAYETMMQVLSHERCLNCHPSDNVPKQGDDSHPHYFGMSRGASDKGFAAMQCATCHQNENNAYSGVPGAPHWALAPKTMAWEGLSKKEIAEVMLDRSKNGNRSHKDLIHHLTADKLVLWAFNPGVDNEGNPRSKPPVSEEEYKAAVKEWFQNGAIIPE